MNRPREMQIISAYVRLGFFQAEDGIRDKWAVPEFRRVLFR
eukprot:COSAG01_NODE_72665_length_252_cov_0.882353_1_plen_40_part_10